MIHLSRIKIFADGASLKDMKRVAQDPNVKGFTTNPTLMREAGVEDYKGFALSVLEHIKDRPVSFEVFADDLPTMEAQAREIATWGDTVNVKIPITNTRGESTAALVGRLSHDGIAVNVTAMFTPAQVKGIVDVLKPGVPTILSVFAGRIADTGRDPAPVMQECLKLIQDSGTGAALLWASPREVFNIVQADQIGCQIITVTPELIAKLNTLGKDLDEFSLDTVKMFYEDAAAARYSIPVDEAPRAATL